MSVIGSGIDIVDIRRVQRIYTKHPRSFANRILHKVELAEFDQQRNKLQYLSSRFAVKEAISKSLGVGMRGKVSWKNIYITHDKFGKPVTNFEKAIAGEIDIDNVEVSVSISHEKNYTVAQAIAFSKT